MRKSALLVLLVLPGGLEYSIVPRLPSVLASSLNHNKVLIFAFTAVPSAHHAAMLPLSFITAAQRRLRMPLNVLAGLHTCKCGAQVDPHGDHVLSCPHMLHIRTGAWHDSIMDVVCKMTRMCNHTMSVDSRRPRAVSAVYSPMWCPDVTLLHEAPTYRGSCPH